MTDNNSGSAEHSCPWSQAASWLRRSCFSLAALGFVAGAGLTFALTHASLGCALH